VAAAPAGAAAVCSPSAERLAGLSAIEREVALRPALEGSSPAAAPSAFDGWSGDRLLGAALEAVRGRWAGCVRPEAITALTASLQNAYLIRRGVLTVPTDSRQREILFRGLLMPDAQAQAVRPRLEKLAAGSHGALELLAALYGGAAADAGTVFVGPQSAAARDQLAELREQLCAAGKVCPGWSAAYVPKVVVAGEQGLAAWIPETGTLVISEGLVTAPNDLHRLVVLHELVHAAAARARDGGADWLASYRAFSGWRTGADGRWEPEWEPRFEPIGDELTRLSQGSPFSLLPDGTAPPRGTGHEARDGYVLAKAFRDARDRGDLEEDLASTVAVALVAPSRFCRQGKPIAPRKQAWIAREVLGRAVGIGCGQAFKARPEHKSGTRSGTRPD
jgi:hypothetical protein